MKRNTGEKRLGIPERAEFQGKKKQKLQKMAEPQAPKESGTY